MSDIYDIAIIGAGAMGSAAAWHLSKTGQNTLVLDQFVPPHKFGSSHGESRIIREAYFESPLYVPLVQQAYALWSELEDVSGNKLFLKTGGLMLGDRNQKVFRGASTSAHEYNIPVEYLESDEIERRYPVMKPIQDTVALFESNAGILFPEKCISSQLELAQKRGVRFQFDEKVFRIKRYKNEVEIVTNKSAYKSHKIIVCNGAWISELLPEVQLPLSVKRQVLFWFKCSDDDVEKFSPPHFPIYIWEHEPNKIFYGFPDLGNGIKIAIHHRGQLSNPETINRNVSADEINEMAQLLKEHFKTEVSFNFAMVCMYTNTPDENFIIDCHPENKNVIIVSVCSGHGFKFSSAIGKILSDIATDNPLNFDITPFNIARFIS